MKRIQLVFLQRVPWGGGAERVVYDLARGINKQKFLVRVVCLYQGGDIPKSLKNPDIPYIRLKGKEGLVLRMKRLFPVLNRLRIKTRLRYMNQAWKEGRFLSYMREKCCNLLGILPKSTRMSHTADVSSQKGTSPPTRLVDDWIQAGQLTDFIKKITGPLVIVAVMEEAASVVRLALGKQPHVPYLLSTHAWESSYLPIMYGSPGYDVEREKFLFAEACQEAAAVLSPCDGCRDDLIECFDSPAKRTLTMPNPIDISAIQLAMQKPLEKNLPVQWGNTPFFIVVARYDPQKRHDRILQACALLRERTENFRVLFVGEGFWRKQVEKEITKLGLSRHVCMIGQCANPFPYMCKAVGLICASEEESFGLTLAEALVCGCVPISVDCPHGPRYVLDNGKGGFLVEKTSRALAGAMLAVLEHPEIAHEKIAHGQAYIRHFDLPLIVRQWETLVENIARAHYAL